MRRKSENQPVVPNFQLPVPVGNFISVSLLREIVDASFIALYTPPLLPRARVVYFYIFELMYIKPCGFSPSPSSRLDGNNFPPRGSMYLYSSGGLV